MGSGVFFMRINKMDNVFQVYNKNLGVKNIKTNKSGKSSDELKISENAMDFQFAINKVKDVEDIRVEKVEKIKEQIKSGTYEIDGKKIAEKIYNSINFDQKI
jgi:negative regulator of flagellin synthesis FlgM